MVVHSIHDIVGPILASPIVASPQPTPARWILFTSTGVVGASVCGLGDVAGPTQGAHLSIGNPTMFPPNPADPSDLYDLSQMQAYVPSGCTLTITYGV